jgi:lipopolysaccharide/colanic/teichoic acid biosynthesis glycosyltransferase
MEAVLQRERMRADRTGRTFSLLALELEDKDRRNGGMDRLVRILKKRLRATDDAGWLSSREVGVVLPDTSAAGAWKVAADIADQYAQTQPPQCEVYTYPSTWLPPAPGHNGAARDRSAARPAQPLESLFVRPLPPWKRVVDLLGAVIGLVISSPILLAAMLAIKCTSPGPVLFRQQRSGLGGKPFMIYKLRTMVLGAELRKQQLLPHNEQDGPAFKMTHDPRVTPVGRFLRSTSIDELPQLWNVLRGEMSLVGPRPLPCHESADCVAWQRQRLDVTPGLTCIWQVRGRSTVTFTEWMRMDRQYVGNRSLLNDLKILAATAPAVLTRRGAR